MLRTSDVALACGLVNAPIRPQSHPAQQRGHCGYLASVDRGSRGSIDTPSTPTSVLPTISGEGSRTKFVRDLVRTTNKTAGCSVG
ncbi:hypothetical protein DACRYDRAFT_19653 [Dacryopinax primogenitus]|uniref:Uncharacterized protein n=1 Tax=Dacryopinax primogenitus (strain DJM 731) TaxID=1858805 RepID=M5GC05_DACPD|nr:uncharacterized protein DACRYDRAFT_19653 [Dacryopinax primogenitus]EJU06544.1 hypothetical protein DACRYDRAFT_19653 [Dacryopinax primogenitus]